MANKRFKHALEASLWMSNKRRLHESPYDLSVRLKLILKNFGLQQAENYFYKIPENLRTYQLYLGLLNCYVMAKCVDKAEPIMQKARDLGYASKPVWYNLLMNLYCQSASRGKLGDLLIEMEEKGIPYDDFTYSVCFSACAMARDAEGMNKVVRIMKSIPRGAVHWRTWCIAAKGYLTIGLVDEAMATANKLEKELNVASPGRKILFVLLIDLYAEAGKKDDLYRVWELYKKKEKVINKIYISMMRSLMKFGDTEGMEKIFEEWESSTSSFDFRVPNFLINAYCSDGHMEKGEALVSRVMTRGGTPIVATWCHFVGGCLEKNQVSEAVRYLRKAISACPPKFVSLKNCLITCLGYLEKGDRMEKAEELINNIRTKGISEWFCNDFPSSTEDRELQSCGEDQDSEIMLDGEDECKDDLEANLVPDFNRKT